MVVLFLGKVVLIADVIILVHRTPNYLVNPNFLFQPDVTIFSPIIIKDVIYKNRIDSRQRRKLHRNLPNRQIYFILNRTYL